MYLELDGFLNSEEVEELRLLAGSGTFNDGRSSAPGLEGVKHNEQLVASEPESARLHNLLSNAAQRSVDFGDFAQPKKIRAPMLSRYTPGMKYGRHLDSPILQKGDPMRVDLSMTVFLSAPGSYEGGALVLETPYGEIECKPRAGSAVLYDAGCWHEVEEVSKGVRLALITWIQSRVVDPANRSIVYDIAKSYREIAHEAPDSDVANRLFRLHSNLIRRWSDV